MKYCKLGNTGLIVSRLSLGTMTFGNDPSIPSVYKVGVEDASAMVDKALETGINFFDSADGYSGGQSEEMLGKILGKRRQDVVISTKVPVSGPAALLRRPAFQNAISCFRANKVSNV